MVIRKRRVLAFIGCYLPGYKAGGPIRTMVNLVDRLGDEFDFYIVTMNRDLGSSEPYASVVTDAWNTVGKAQVFYASSEGSSFRSLINIMRMTPHDVLYLNGFFHPVFTLKPILIRKFFSSVRAPTIVAPHGEFSPGALQIKQRKKQLFMALENLAGLFNDVIWHASTPFEAKDIASARAISEEKVVVATNIVAKASVIEQSNKIKELSDKRPLSICFLSRISPMKNLDFALNVLMGVSEPVEFFIYGPKESIDYWKSCEKIIKALPSNVSVAYKGSINPADVKRTIANHDVFFVPSQGENFGHVFIEAFAAGVPVLVSDRTPWRSLKAKNIGWDISLDQPYEFRAAIEDMLSWTTEQHSNVRNACLHFAEQLSQSEDAVRMHQQLFNNA